MLIVSLSSVPPRFGKLRPTLDSLVHQSAKIESVRLYIPRAYRRFPDWDGSLPEVPPGVEIIRTETDYGPSSKVLHAAEELAGQDVDILFCDDDRYYPQDWAQSFLNLKADHPRCVIAHSGFQVHTIAKTSKERRLQPRAIRRWRITDWRFQLAYLWQDIRAGSKRRELAPPQRKVFKQSGYVDVFEGNAGVLTHPSHFDADFFDIPPILWGVDDVWLSGMMARKGIAFWLESGILDLKDTDAEQEDPLAHTVIDGADRKSANRQGIAYFQEHHGIWL